MAAQVNGTGERNLTRTVEDRLREALKVALRDHRLNRDLSEEGFQTVTTLEVEGALIAIVSDWVALRTVTAPSPARGDGLSSEPDRRGHRRQGERSHAGSKAEAVARLIRRGEWDPWLRSHPLGATVSMKPLQEGRGLDRPLPFSPPRAAPQLFTPKYSRGA